MADNLSYMADFKPLSEDEKKVIKQAQDILDGIDSIPCTSCHYCTDGCPMQIPIPEIFSARNKQLIWEQKEAGQDDYDKAVSNKGMASACIQCGQCEGVCPQHIDIINRLQDCAAAFE